MRKEVLLAATLIFGINSFAQTTVTTYTPEVSTEGIVYYLPKTVINVDITIKKTNYIPGELCQYAERYLRINNISDQEDLHYNLQDITITPSGIPDPSKVFHIKYSTNSIAPLVSLDDKGILLAINTTQDSTPPSPTNHYPSKAGNKIGNIDRYLTEEMLMTSSKAKLAELAAKEIYNIRESRNLFIRGQNDNMPQDGEALQIIFDGLREQEEALMQLFTGTTTTEYITKRFEVIPDSCAERVVIARLSRKMGILHPDDLAGAPIYIDIKSHRNLPITTIPSGPNDKEGKSIKKQKTNKQDGVVYNLPEDTDIKVYTNSEVLAEATFPIAQFGKTETLSSSFFSKKKEIKVTLNPTSGAITRITD